MHSKRYNPATWVVTPASNSCSELLFHHPTAKMRTHKKIHLHKQTYTLNYSQQELSDRFTLQPGGMNIHTLKLPSAVSSGIRLTTAALTHTFTHAHTKHYTPASHSSRTSHTSRSRPVGILQLWQGYRRGGTPRG